MQACKDLTDHKDNAPVQYVQAERLEQEPYIHHERKLSGFDNL